MVEVIWLSLWGGDLFPRNAIFNKVLIEDGLCFTFNMLNKSELLRNEE